MFCCRVCDVECEMSMSNLWWGGGGGGGGGQGLIIVIFFLTVESVDH